MKQFEFEGKTYNLCNSWEDMTLQRYINFFLYQDSKKEGIMDELYLMEIIEILSDCDVLMEVPMETLKSLISEINFLSTTPKLTKGDVIHIDAQLYKCVNLNELTAGEYISIKMLMGDEKTVLQGLPKLLSIIVRPAEEFIDKETGKKRYKIEKFAVDNLDWRAEKFLSLRIVDVLHWTTFFLTGKKQSLQTSQRSTNQKVIKKEIHGHL